MNKKQKCKICGKPVGRKGIGFANHMAMHEMEEALAKRYGWSDRNPFKAKRPVGV